MSELENDQILPIESVEAVAGRRPAVDPDALRIAGDSIESLRVEGEAALRRFIADFDEWAPIDAARASMRFDRDDLRAAVDRIDPELRTTIERITERIRAFATAQLSCLSSLRMPIAGTDLVAGHDVVPIEHAGCYAPGGRFPLPSSVLMTVIPATVAGVRSIRLASPRPTDATLAAAWFAGVDDLLCAGGAHAIGALALGVAGVACDVIVGPGNAYVTAAKAIVSGAGWADRGPVAIDALAGPSELLVLADATADPTVIAADLLAQAEHDPDAGVWLATTSDAVRFDARRALAAACAALPEPNRGIARRSIARGAAIVVESDEALVRIADRLAPEHLEILVEDPDRLANRVTHAGAVFLGGAAEVFGDYGVGPNHVLPTGGTARHRAGLSVLDFVRVRTRLERCRHAEATNINLNINIELVRDIAALARAEGLEGHARAAEIDRFSRSAATSE